MYFPFLQAVVLDFKLTIALNWRSLTLGIVLSSSLFKIYVLRGFPSLKFCSSLCVNK